MAEPWDIKHDRANELLVELRRSIRELKQSGGFAAVTEEWGKERAVRVVLKTDIPDRLSAIVGDIVHNARSSLDTVALAVCDFGSGGKLSEEDERRVQFPITSDPADWKKQSRFRLPCAEKDHLGFMREHQPWYWIEQATVKSPAEKEESVKHHPLSTLQSLSNIDKHRAVHLTALYADVVFAGADDGVIKAFRTNETGRSLQDGDVIGWWLLSDDVPSGTGFFPRAELDLSLRYHLDLNWRGAPVGQFLESLVAHARHVVVPLARMIGRG